MFQSQILRINSSGPKANSLDDSLRLRREIVILVLLIFTVLLPNMSIAAEKNGLCTRVLSWVQGVLNQKKESNIKVSAQEPSEKSLTTKASDSAPALSRDLTSYSHTLIPQSLLDVRLSETTKSSFPFYLVGTFVDTHKNEYFIIRPGSPQNVRKGSHPFGHQIIQRYRGFPERLFSSVPGFAKALGMERITDPAGRLIEYRIPTAKTQNEFIEKLNKDLPEESQIGIRFYTPMGGMVPYHQYLYYFQENASLPITEKLNQNSYGESETNDILHDIFVHRISLLFPKLYIDHLRSFARLFYWVQLDVIATAKDPVAILADREIGLNGSIESSLGGNIDAALAYITLGYEMPALWTVSAVDYVKELILNRYSRNFQTNLQRVLSKSSPAELQKFHQMRKWDDLEAIMLARIHDLNTIFPDKSKADQNRIH